MTMQEAMVGAAVGASIQVLLQCLLSKSMKEIHLIYGLKKDMAKLENSLRLINDYLSDAQVQRLNNKSVATWLQQLESAAFRADAALDEINYHLLRKEVENKRKTIKVSSISCFLRFKMAHKIKDINKELEVINKNAQSYGLQTAVVVGSQTSSHVGGTEHSDRETDSFMVDPVVVGREDDMSRIVEMLVAEAPTHDVFSVVPIVGMGGIGKTTLARRVFNDEKINSHFGKKVWVCVPENYDAKTLFKMILESLTLKPCGKSKEGFLKTIQQHLGSNRYLLILDDVWSEEFEKWNDFISSLSGVSSAKRNGIIVTTRKVAVATRVQTLPFHQLSTLSNDDCWSIIKAKAFEGADVPSDFEEIGKCIAQRCKGLPLAAKVIGGMLKGNSRKEWLSILETQLPYSDQDENYIQKILKLSFDRLPSSSHKKCFAYCSIFPQDFELKREQLIELWMAEGFLQTHHGNEPETFGKKIFNHLLQNSLLQEAERNEHGNITCCKMHNLVHDLACSVSGMKDSVSNVMHQVRYLSLDLGKDELFPISQEQAKYLRTLFFKGTVVDNMFSNFKCLHVLKLVGDDIKESSIQIENLIHLRYLEISSRAIESLPDTVGKLFNLQTLCAKTLVKLPSTIINLISLRHLHIGPIELPPGIGKLTCLRTLSSYKVGDEEGCGIVELGRLKNLGGKLEIQNLEKVNNKEEATSACLFEKSSILHLTLVWGKSRRSSKNDENVLEGLQPPRNLKSLEIEGYKGKKFPLWTMKMEVHTGIGSTWVGLDNLVDIKLSYCDQCEEIPMFGQLPHLKSLYLFSLSNVKSIGLRFYGIESCKNISSNIFPSLEWLELYDMPQLTEWLDVQVATTVFPCLEHLSIVCCPRLESVPSHFASLKKLLIEDVVSSLPLANICDGNLSSLKELVIGEMPGLICLPSGLFVKNQNLTELTIQGCPNLTHLVPCSLNGGASLINLDIRNCENLRELPNDLHTLQSLKTLSIIDCAKLMSIPYQIGGPTQGGLISLQKMNISECSELTTLPIAMLESCAERLEYLTLRRLPNLMNIFEVIACVPRMLHLSGLTIQTVPKLMSFPPEFGSLKSLRTLCIGHFSDLIDIASFNNMLHRIFQVSNSLRSLYLYGNEHWESLPDQLSSLTALEVLYLCDFGLIEALPDWLGKLSSLRDLNIWNCKKLMRLPSKEAIQHLGKLESLVITGCPLLRERCSQQQGTESDDSEWSKISHIPMVYTV